MPSLSKTLKLAAAATVLLHCSLSSSAFAPANSNLSPRQHTAIHEASRQVDGGTDIKAPDASRRQILEMPIFLAASSAFAFQSQPAFAAKDTVEEDKAKLLKGYERLNYLLNNWDKLTTKCGLEKDPFSGEQVCEKTPLVVQDYIGYKSMNDPLFKADKTLRRLEDLVPAAKDAEYFDAVEKWSTAVEEAAGMAYTSSWAGPQNPNGGDDSIAYYLERAKKQTTDARDALKAAIGILQLK